MIDLFEWDEAKERSNQKKHGVSFEEAATIFGDRLAITKPDPDHSETEERFVSVGMGIDGRLIVVSHVFRDEKIRLISARKATPRERKDYAHGEDR